MPVRIPETLPARDILRKENIFVMGEQRAEHQDIRPLELAILNLMPTKAATETQLLRLLGNSSLQVNITLLHMCSHQSKNTSAEHLIEHYVCFDDINGYKFDGLVITGAPVELLDFEEVDYWSELRDVMDWSESNVYSTFHICWAAQAGLYHRYGVQKYPLADKMFGVFPHHICVGRERLLRGFDDEFYAPHSRHTEIRRRDLETVSDVEILAESDQAGVYIVADRSRRHFYITGHSEYDPLTLKGEYDRDVQKGLPIAIPRNYYPQDDPTREPVVRWRGHANLLYTNWLNYYVYQQTPFDLKQIPGGATLSNF
jgi:homoserine O-succinyltransferase/O-acetyltransferase